LSTNATAWTAFKRAYYYQDRKGELVAVPPDHRLFMNSRYQVYMTEPFRTEPFGEILWLSIKRLDKQPIHDWRDIQRIKNELVGKEVEAVEIYPSESRLVDSCNQYHLWCFPEGYKLPFGYEARLVMEVLDDKGGAVQRPWDPDNRPTDLTDLSELERRTTNTE